MSGSSHGPADTPPPGADKAALYAHVQGELAAMLEAERDFLANMANCAALIFHRLPELNWAGFYLLKTDTLVLGPFQGKPACVRIPVGRGVCGTAAARRETIIVPDVHQFPGHIACDGASNSELVVPLIQESRLVGVLDLDSPQLGRFDAQDAAGLQSLARILLNSSAIAGGVMSWT